MPARSIWVHAVSVGEVQAAVPLVEALLKRFPADPAGADHGHAHGPRARRGAVRHARRRALRAHRPAGLGAALLPARAAAARDHPRDRDLAQSLPSLRPARRAAGAGQRAHLAALGDELSPAGRPVSRDAVARHLHRRAERGRRGAVRVDRRQPGAHARGGQHQVRLRLSTRHGSARPRAAQLVRRASAGVGGGQHAREGRRAAARRARADPPALLQRAAGAGAAPSAALRRSGGPAARAGRCRSSRAPARAA